MRKTCCVLGLVSLLAAAGPGETQVLPVAVELRATAGLPVGDFGDDEGHGADPGVGVGVGGSLSLLPGVALYGGWSRTVFGGGETSFGVSSEFVDTGFAGGLRVGLPIPFGPNPYVKAGALYHDLKIDIESDVVDGVNDVDMGNALGFEIGAGLEIPLGLVISFTPEVSYRSYDTDPADDGPGEMRVRYFTAGLGMLFRI